MKYKIVVSGEFEKEFKRLAKRYSSLKDDVSKLGGALLLNPTLGIPIGNGCYKIRLAISSKGKGKSGGARVITHVQVTEEFIYLLSIYDKSEVDNIRDAEIRKRIANIEGT